MNKDRNLIIGKRNLNDRKWILHKTQYKAFCRDAHNIVSIGVDGDGFLHVSFDQHAQKLKYCKSKYPGSLELTELTSMTGYHENSATYPDFHHLSNGDILFNRDGSSGNGNLVINYYDLKNKKWNNIQKNLIDREKLRNAYW